MKKLILIGDIVADPIRLGEIESALRGALMEDGVPSITSIPATRSTTHTGFLLAQMAQTEARLGTPRNTVAVFDTDPRCNPEESVTPDAGARFVVARLRSGMYVMGPHAGHVLSFLRDQIDTLFTYDLEHVSGGFHAREQYARIASYFLMSRQDDLELEELSQAAIPPLLDHVIGHIDPFGVIITSYTLSEVREAARPLDRLPVTIGTITKRIPFHMSLFDAAPGALCLYPSTCGTQDDPYMAIAVRTSPDMRDTAVRIFDEPLPGARVGIVQTHEE